MVSVASLGWFAASPEELASPLCSTPHLPGGSLRFKQTNKVVVTSPGPPDAVWGAADGLEKDHLLRWPGVFLPTLQKTSSPFSKGNSFSGWVPRRSIKIHCSPVWMASKTCLVHLTLWREGRWSRNRMANDAVGWRETLTDRRGLSFTRCSCGWRMLGSDSTGQA